MENEKLDDIKLPLRVRFILWLMERQQPLRWLGDRLCDVEIIILLWQFNRFLVSGEYWENHENNSIPNNPK